MVNGYRSMSVVNLDIPFPYVALREEVDVHLVPDLRRGALEARMLWNNRMVQSVTYRLKDFLRVQF